MQKEGFIEEFNYLTLPLAAKRQQLDINFQDSLFYAKKRMKCYFQCIVLDYENFCCYSCV